MEGENLNKKTLLFLGAILIIALLVLAGLIFYLFQNKSATKNTQTQQKLTKESLNKAINTPAQSTIKISVVEQEKIQESINTPALNPAPIKIPESDILKSINTSAQK